MAQEIGLRSKFLVGNFNRGLNQYIAGLNRAVTQTQQAQSLINQAGSQMSSVFGTAALAAFALSTQTRNLANALQRTSNVSTRVAANIRSQGSAAAGASSNVRQLSGDLNRLNTGAIALGTAFGITAVAGVRAFLSAISRMSSSIVETVTFFERLELSVEFYAARSIRAKDATLDFNAALAQSRDLTEGTLFFLQRLAVASPFTTRDVGTLFRTAQAYGLLREEALILTPLLLDFAAAAGLDRDILERLALAMGQVRARGKLTGEEVRQLGNSGIPIRDILVEALGIANSEFDEFLEKGRLTSDVVIPAIIQSLQEFQGAGERVAFETIGGIISAFDELAEISVARFFRGALDPLRQEFKDLFDVLNQPQVLAFVQVLGEEFGVRLVNAFNGLRNAISGLIQGWLSLDPVLRDQIIIFGAVFIAATTLLSVTSLLFFAINALVNPITVTAAAIAGFAAIWSRANDSIRRTVGGLVTFVGNSLSSLVEIAGDSGIAIADIFVTGLETIVPGVTRVIGALSELLVFWLAPFSPPRIAPDIDIWGQEAMELYIAGLGEPGQDVVARTVQRVGKTIQETVDRAAEGVTFGTDIIGRTIQRTAVSFRQDIQDAIVEPIKDLDEDVAEVGIDLGTILATNFLEGWQAPQPVRQISQELAEALARLGGGRELSISGARLLDQFIDSFKEADFSALSEVGGIIQDSLESFVDLGTLRDIDVPRILSDFRIEFSRAIDEFRRFGTVSEATFARIQSAAGPADDRIGEFLRTYLELSVRTDAVEQAQERLNTVTAEYTKLIEPLRKELQQISEARRTLDEQRQIAELERVIANQAAGALRKQSAELQIQEILSERRLRNLERERDAAVETGEKEVDAAQKAQEEVQGQLDLLKATLDARNAQLALAARESSIISKLEAEVAKLRAQEKTDLELQLELLKLQQDEIGDILKEARAKFILSQADSTELEKQQALLDLQEIALRRANRLVEVRELGFSESEITKLADISITLEDLNIKASDALTPLGTSLDEILAKAPDLTKQAAEWRAELERVRDRWGEIKQQIIDTATTINEKLPDFLKIFPEEEGGEPPLVTTLKRYQTGIFILAGIFAATKIIAKIRSLIGALVLLRGIVLAPAIINGFAALSVALVRFVPFTALVSTAILLLRQGFDNNFLSMRKTVETFRLAVSDEFLQIGQGVLAFAEFLASIPSLIFTSEGRQRLRESFAATVAIFRDPNARSELLKDALSLGDDIGNSFFESFIASSGNLPLAIVHGTAKTGAVLEEDSIFKEQGKTAANVFGQGMREALDAIFAEGTVLVPFEEELNREIEAIAVDPALAIDLGSNISDLIAQGFDPEIIKTEIGASLSEGIVGGFAPDDLALKQAVNDYVDAILLELVKKTESKSPSKLTAREVGEPLGEGVLVGFRDILEGKIEVAGESIIAFAELLRDKVVPVVDDFGKDSAAVFKTLVTTSLQQIRSLQTGIKVALDLLVFDSKQRIDKLVGDFNTAFVTIRTDSESAITGMGDNIENELNALNTSLVTIMSAIKNTIVDAFVQATMETETQIGLLITSVTNLLGGDNETSLVNQTRQVLLGADNIVPRQIGADFIDGLAMGITDNQQTLANALVGAIRYAFAQAANFTQTDSPSRLAATALGLPISLGVAGGILEGAGVIASSMQNVLLSAINQPLDAQFLARPSTIVPGNITNISQTRNFNLNVRSETPSQGLRHDFAILETMASVG